MEGFTQEIKNLAQMEFVQFWRKYAEAFPGADKEDFKNMFCAAFCGGAVAATKLTVMGFDRVREGLKDDRLPENK